MRGTPDPQLAMLSSLSTEDLIPADHPIRRIRVVVDAVLAELDPVAFKKFNFKGANNDTVWGFTLKPAGPQFAAAAKLPIAFVVHGGPQGSFSNSWSYRWNPRVFASPGYAVVSVDFHGSTGYGQAFTDAINKNWGGWPLLDLQRGLDFALKQDIMLDGDRACALGGSYGGYMMNWIEGQWPDRFKCIVQHDGVFDARAREVILVRRIAAHEVDAVPGWVLVDIGEDHDLRRVLVAHGVDDAARRVARLLRRAPGPQGTRPGIPGLPALRRLRPRRGSRGARSLLYDLGHRGPARRIHRARLYPGADGR